MFGPRVIHRLVHRVGRALVCLTLLAFVARAMVPVGFMPDPDALRAGRVQVVLCQADSASAVLVLDLGGNGKSRHIHHAAAMACPFGMLAAQALGAPLTGAGVAAPSLAAYFAARLAVPPVTLRACVSGPPLGSRAPPVRAA